MNIRILLVCVWSLATFSAMAQRSVARACLNEARVLFAAEDYARAAETYRKILSLSDSIPDYILLNTYNELAHCHVMSGEYKEAQSAYDSALPYVGDDDDHDALMLGMADLCVMSGRYADADSALSQIVCRHNFNRRDIYRATVMARQFRNADAVALLDTLIDNIDRKSALVPMQNRGFILSQSRNPDTLRLARKDLVAVLAELDRGKDIYYISLSNLAMVEAKMADFDAALRDIETAMDWFAAKYQPARRYSDYIIALRKKAEILMMASRRNDAVDAYKEFYREESEYVKRNFVAMSEQNRLDFWKKEKPFISRIFALENDAPEFLYDVALLRREIALSGGIAAISDSVRILRRLSTTGSDVQRSLLADEVVIDFVRYEKCDTAWYGAIIVPPQMSGRNMEFLPLWTEAEFNNLNIGNRSLRDAVCSGYKMSDKDKIYQNPYLARYIWTRLLPYIDYARKVYFAPDGLLHMLAVEYLYPLCRPDDKKSFYRLSSTARLLERRESTDASSGEKMLVVGGFDYDYAKPEDADGHTLNHDAIDYLLKYAKPRRGFFVSLPNARREMCRIDSIMTDADTASVTTEEMFKSDMFGRRYDNVHLVTHGYALDVDVPAVPELFCDSITEDMSLLASGIAFAGANVAYLRACREDGIVSARELCDMDLSNVDLMVISACRSAQGRSSDEGPAGLVRGLKKSGVKSVIATLWEIDDRASFLFMSRFYEVLRQTHDKRMALAAAQAYLRDEYEVIPSDGVSASERIRNRRRAATGVRKPYRPYTSPFYWAAFVLIDGI